MQATSARPSAHLVSRSGWQGTAPFVAALVGVTLAAAACGGSGGSSGAGVAHVGRSTPTTSAVAAGTQPGAYGPNYQRNLKYTQCMRKNGVRGFPEPNSQGDFLFRAGGGSTGSSGTDPNSPAFQAAQKACKALAPAAPTASQSSSFLAQALKFTECIAPTECPSSPTRRKSAGM